MPESSPELTVTIPTYEYSAQELAKIEAQVEEFETKRRLGLLVNSIELDSYFKFYGKHRSADNYSTVLQVMYPGEKWTMTGNDYSTLSWEEGNRNPKPTEEELMAHRPAVQDYLLQEEYIAKRQMCYPPESLLTRALWEWLVEGKPHLKDCVQKIRQAVKTAFPKPLNTHPLIESEAIMKKVPQTPADFYKTVEQYIEEVALMSGSVNSTPGNDSSQVG
jgi:hypothetical protein